MISRPAKTLHEERRTDERLSHDGAVFSLFLCVFEIPHMPRRSAFFWADLARTTAHIPLCSIGVWKLERPRG